jgi:HEPN domain-containing protein
MKEETIKHWKQALYELDVANDLIKAGKYSAASFHSQQAAEMALKALFFEKRGELYKDHKLYELATKLKVPSAIYKKCSNLNPVYISTRYFDARADEKIPAEEYDKHSAVEYYNQSEDILKWVSEQLGTSMN